ncbi:MAG: DEAD/DEAH box helicase, partial [Chrysiogenetes bacterium]|nr:DEAD/DEAH box helicase [Chrysiogenetes bacterium]
QRDRAMEGFRRGRSDILVATDIAARGIDVANISHVVNFDVPNTPDAYTHRIGRTGRAEKQGKAFTFVTTEDRRQVIGIERKIGARIDRCSIAGFEDPAARFDQRSRPPRENAGRSGPPRGRSNGPRGPRNGPREDSRAPRSADSRDRNENRGNRRDARDDRGAPAGGRFANRNERGSVAGNRDRDENRGNRRESPPRDRRDDNRGNRAPRAEGRGNAGGNGGSGGNQRYGRSDSRPGQGAGRGSRTAAGGGNRKSGGNAGGRTRRNSRAS